ncbi:unnamed protein product, partial [Symbiodinium pilosum]
MTPSVWLEYSNYLLGEKVYLMQIPSPSGKGKTDQVALRPPWTVMINYEFELRKEAVKRAFRDSRAGRCAVEEQFFTSPIALQNRNMPPPSTWYERPNSGQPWKWRKGEKGPGKGEGKDTQKGKDPKGKKGKGNGELASRTPDGRLALPTRLLAVQVTAAWYIVAKSEGAS